MAIQYSGHGKMYSPKGDESKQSYTDHLTAQPAKSHVTIIKKDSLGEHVTKDEDGGVSAPLVHKPNRLARVQVKYGKTINLGNYESARIDIALEIPADMDDLEPCYSFASEWVGAKMEELLKEVK